MSGFYGDKNDEAEMVFWQSLWTGPISFWGSLPIFNSLTEVHDPDYVMGHAVLTSFCVVIFFGVIVGIINVYQKKAMPSDVLCRVCQLIPMAAGAPIWWFISLMLALASIFGGTMGLIGSLLDRLVMKGQHK